MPCMHGWLNNINAVKYLFANLEFEFLPTNQLNQDCLENMFSVVRGKGGHRDNPNPQQFRAAFRQILVDQLLTKSDVSNCEDDLDKVLLDLVSLSNNAIKKPPGKERLTPLSVPIPPGDVISLPGDLSLENVSCYVGGYVLKKMELSCANCQNRFTLCSVPVDQPVYTFLRKKLYSPHCKLVCPSVEFVQFVDKLENLYVTNFPSVMFMHGLIQRLELMSRPLQGDILSHCADCNCHSKLEYGVKLFFKVRVNATLKRKSCEIREKREKGCKKLMKLQHL